MKATLLLKIASGIMFLHTIGHTFGTLNWKKTDDPIKKQVINEMTSHKFPFMGANKGFTDTMDGYGFAMILALLFITAVLWIASNNLQDNSVRPTLIFLCFILLLLGIIELKYFFLFAALFTLLSMILILVSLISFK